MARMGGSIGGDRVPAGLLKRLAKLEKVISSQDKPKKKRIGVVAKWRSKLGWEEEEYFA